MAKVTLRTIRADDPELKQTHRCRTCHGTGEVMQRFRGIEYPDDCPTCGGTGLVGEPQEGQEPWTSP